MSQHPSPQTYPALVLLTLGILTSTPDLARSSWTEPVNLGPAVNTAADEYGGSLSGDGLTLIFDSNRAGGLGGHDLYSATWNGSSFGGVLSLGSGVNTASTDYAPSQSPDGNTLYFTSTTWDLYTAQKVSGTWGSRTKLTALSTTSAEEWAPGVAGSGTTLVFSALNRIGGSGGHDLWFSQKVAGVWQAPTNAGSPLNTIGHEYAASLNAAGDGIVFARGGDLYESTKIAGVWQPPTALEGAVNTEFYETHPVLSADGLVLYFASERPGGQGGYDLWMSNALPPSDVPDSGPAQLRLVVLGPNPFRSEARLSLELPGASDLRVEIVGANGQRVRTLVDGSLLAGRHLLVWDARDHASHALPAGAYFVRLSGPSFERTQKLLLIR